MIRKEILSQRKFWSSVAIFISGGLFVAFGIPFFEGFFGNHYNPITDVVVCNSYELCLHEAAHKMDRELGMISTTEEWQQAVHLNAYINTEYPELRTPFKEKMALFPGIGSPRVPVQNKMLFGEFTLAGGWGGYSELYASMVEWSLGDYEQIPTEYRQYFNWPLLKVLFKRSGYDLAVFR